VRCAAAAAAAPARNYHNHHHNNNIINNKQVIVIPLHESCNEYAEKVAGIFVSHGFYAEAETSTKKFKRKIAEAQLIAFNYMLCVGPNDMAAGTTGLRARGTDVDERGVLLDEAISRVRACGRACRRVGVRVGV
jgi:threonyl-tRNA synthetase